MSVIIRLQNLPWSANAHDIRQFFNGLSIPEGGVHIVGGELGLAFIGFSTDEDARQAFNLNGGKIKEVQVKLMLSSRAEMYKIIEAARNPLVAFLQVPSMPQSLTSSMPTPVLEVKKEDKEKKSDRRRSRSKSRERKERSRDRDRRDRRRRDRSRSRSRDRRDRRRRDRSHSRDRRSKDRDRRRRSEESTNNSNVAGKELPKTGIWEEPSMNSIGPTLAPAALQQVFLNSLIPKNLEEVSRNLNTITPPSLLSLGRNGMSSLMEPNLGRAQDNWNNSPSHQNINVRSDFPSIFNKIAPQLGGDNNNLNNLIVRPQNIHQLLGNARMPFGGSRRNTRFDQQEDSELPRKCEPGFCVQLRPYYGGYGEVRRFFQGLYIHNTGIKFLNDDNGKRTGIVYIRFATIGGKRDALMRDGEQLKTQKVEVKHLDDDLFNETVDSYQPLRDRNSPDSRLKRNRDSSPISSPPLTQFSCLAIENLPLFTKEQDMLKIFSDYSLLSILLINKQRHQTAYIKFSNIEDAKVAQEEKSMHIFDGTPLTIRPCSDEEFAEISKDEQEEVIEVEDDEEADYPTSDCVMLNGLPLKTNDRDISDFFSDVAIVPNRIHMVNSNLGFTGTAFCEFNSTSDAEIALDKNGLPLGSGIITVTSVTRKEMENKIGAANFGNSGPTSLLNLPRPPFFPRGNFGSPRGNMGMRPSLMGPRPNMRRFRPPPTSDPIDLAPPGHTVRMENVPYKAVLDEILDFFDGFDVPVDNVLRRYNENGTPSGEAKVIFKSANEAHQAVQERNRNKIRDRVIFLSQC